MNRRLVELKKAKGTDSPQLESQSTENLLSYAELLHIAAGLQFELPSKEFEYSPSFLCIKDREGAQDKEPKHKTIPLVLNASSTEQIITCRPMVSQPGRHGHFFRCAEQLRCRDSAYQSKLSYGQQTRGRFCKNMLPCFGSTVRLTDAFCNALTIYVEIPQFRPSLGA